MKRTIGCSRFKRLIGVLIACALLTGYSAPEARAAISTVEVQVVPNVAKVSARYTVSFVTGVGLAAGDAVLLQFPQGTTLPCSPCNPLVYADEVTVNDLHPKQPAFGNPSAGTLKVFVPEAIAAGGAVRIVISTLVPRVGNPDIGTYRIRVSTDHEPSVESAPYTIGTSQIMAPTVHLESTIANVGSGYSITFVTGVTGQLVQGSSVITITYAAGGFPAAPVNGAVTVNGLASERILTNPVKHTMEILSPLTVDTRSAVTIAIGAGYGLTNPVKAGNYVLYVHTSAEPGDVASEPFQIKDLPMVSTTIYVGPGTPDGQNGWYVSEPMVTLAAASNVEGRLELHYGIDSEPTTLYTVPFQIPSGVHTLKYRARNVDADIDEESVKTAEFRVATTGPVLTIDGTEQRLVTSSSFTLTGSVAPSPAPVTTVDILGRETHIIAGGTFSEPLTLFEGANELRVTATDESGRTTSATVSVTVDTVPPRMTVSAPVNWQEIHAEKVMVRGNVESGAVLQVNGTTVPNAMPDGSFAHEVALTIGTNTISVTAQDAAGNVRKVAVLVTRVPANESTIVLTIGNKYMTINGTKREIDPGRSTVPVIQNGRTLVPIAAIIEALGGKVTWAASARTATVTLGDTELVLAIGGPTAYVNGKSTPIDTDTKVTPVIVNDRTMLPFRFVAEQLGGTVQWNAATRTVVLHFNVS
ncbi:stalk domain-containing protein [Candidatus Cryosericum terrychapinii]|nr:stalk domain-containing protein [Candidatus Cryosericum terrychapinii]